jgi:zinc transporter ZupT
VEEPTEVTSLLPSKQEPPEDEETEETQQKEKTCLESLKNKKTEGYIIILIGFVNAIIEGVTIGVIFATGN